MSGNSGVVKQKTFLILFDTWPTFKTRSEKFNLKLKLNKSFNTKKSQLDNRKSRRYNLNEILQSSLRYRGPKGQCLFILTRPEVKQPTRCLFCHARLKGSSICFDSGSLLTTSNAPSSRFHGSSVQKLQIV